jgi:hypothetical protein
MLAVAIVISVAALVAVAGFGYVILHQKGVL